MHEPEMTGAAVVVVLEDETKALMSQGPRCALAN